MLVIVGLSVLLFVGVIVFVGVLSNAGVAPPAVRMRRGGAVHEQCERDAQLVQLLISATTCVRNCWPATLSARRRHRHGELDPMRYRFFPAPLGRICCEPFEGEIGSDKTNGVTSATARQHHSKAAARSRRELKGSNTMAYQTVNPYDNHVVATFDDLTDQQVTQLVAQAQNTFESWSQKSFDERAAVCRRAAAILRERADEFARLLTLEMGKLYAESLGEVQLSAEIFDYYAENAEAFLAPERLNTASSDDDAVLVSAPLGVILGIQPWNFPYYQLVRVAAPNLMAGNVVMVKHASNVPQAAAAFERLLAEAGAPQGAYTNLYATKDQLSLLIDDPRVRGVALTGSEGAGAVVAARAGKNLKKSTMELGGSDALIALADADVDKTVAWARHGRMFNGGQCCVASKRIIVVDEIADEFLDRFQVALSELNAGDPFDESTTLPPMSSQGAADDLNEQITAAVEAGAKAIPCGEPVPTTGAFVRPTILTDITPDNPAYYQEFFGPVALFFRVKGEDEAVRLANDSRYGLGGSVFTQDVAHGVEVAKRIDTGMVSINHPTRLKADLPFGGVKISGYGNELADLGIQEFVNKKLINVVPIDAPA
jgi:succinate-semialdehyde dehydrogenase / glutarate-semialdehyde dehydrogenase